MLHLVCRCMVFCAFVNSWNCHSFQIYFKYIQIYSAFAVKNTEASFIFLARLLLYLQNIIYPKIYE